MPARTFTHAHSNAAADASNWTPTGTPAPGDTLTMTDGTMNVAGVELAGDTLTLGQIDTTSSQIFNLTNGAVLATTTAAQATCTTTVNIDGRVTATLGQSNFGTVNYTVNIAANAVLLGTYKAALFGSLTVNGGTGAVFENDDASLIGGVHAVINADVVGTGSFQDSTAQGQTGILEFGRSVAATETINMIGVPARFTGNVKLLTDRPQDFHAAINLDDGTITLKSLTANSYSFNNNILTLYSAGAVTDTLRLHNTTTTNSLPGAPVVPLFVSQSGSDIAISSGGGITPSNPLPLVQPPPQHVAAVAIFDTTTNSAVPDTLTQPYVGPVAGLQQQYINVTPHSLNITASVPNMFIHSGSGNDAIDVSHSGGSNVLDGGTGSNYLTGGSGMDTFFVDDRTATTDIWSTVVNFHSGDAATIFGVTPTGFAFDWEDNQGAVGATGLTLHALAAGKPTASLTLAGYSKSDLSNGRLGISFGSDTAGSPYLYVHAA